MAVSVISLAEAVTATGATTGQCPCISSTTIASLSAAQKTAFGNFLATLNPPWTGPSGGILNVTVSRTGAGTISCTIQGLVVAANAAAALTAQGNNTVDHIIGQAP